MFGVFHIVWMWFSCYLYFVPPKKLHPTPDSPAINKFSIDWSEEDECKWVSIRPVIHAVTGHEYKSALFSPPCPRWERSTGEVNWAWKLIFQRQQRSCQNCLSPRGLQQKVNTMEHKTVSTPRDFLFNSFHCYRYFAAFHSLFSLLFFSSGVYYIRR